MTPALGIAAHPELADPRTRSGFDVRFFPTANGQPPPPVDASQRNECVMLEFLAVYYDLNRHHQAWLEARKALTRPSGTLSHPMAEGRVEGADGESAHLREDECLRAIEKVSILRDELEDLYAPFGVIAEPRVREGVVIDLAFTFGNVDARGKPRYGVLTVSAYVLVPRQPGAPVERVSLRIENPGGWSL